MNLDYCKTFLEVVRRGSFSEAAKALGLSQPTVSFQVQRLEEETGAHLLERHGGRVTLTAAGRGFLAFAQRVAREAERLAERLAGMQQDVSGTLALGASTHPGEHLLPAILGAFRKRFPNASATITIGDTAQIIDCVLERACDAGFVGADIKRRGLVSRKIAEDQLLLIAPPGHRLAARTSIRPSDLTKEAFVVRETGSGTQRTVDQLLERAGVSSGRLRHALVAGSNQALVTAVEAGVGLAFAPRTTVARSLELGRVLAIPVQGGQWVRGIYFVHLAKPVRTRLFQEFSRFVDEWSQAGKR